MATVKAIHTCYKEEEFKSIEIDIARIDTNQKYLIESIENLTKKVSNVEKIGISILIALIVEGIKLFTSKGGI
jgi:hypothetical protein